MSQFSRREFLAGSAAVAGARRPSPARPPPPTGAAVQDFAGAVVAAPGVLRPEGRREEGRRCKFAEIAKKDYDIQAVEYVNQFYKDKKKDDAYLKDLKKVADDNGVRSVLIMCDGEGHLGDPDEKKRQQAVENHYRWVEWAKFLGCHSIRVNAQRPAERPARRTRSSPPTGSASSPSSASKHEIGVIVENHGGLSVHGEWLAGVMKMVDNKYCGTLPDFGNFGTLRPVQGRGRTDAIRQGRLGQVARLRREGRTRRTPTTARCWTSW